MKKYSKENLRALLDASGNPVTGLVLSLRSQLNEKYHRGITSNLCEFSWPKGINGLPLRFELEIIYGCSLNNPTLLRETVVPLEDNTADVTPVTAFVWQTDLIFFYLPRHVGNEKLHFNLNAFGIIGWISSLLGTFRPLRGSWHTANPKSLPLHGLPLQDLGPFAALGSKSLMLRGLPLRGFAKLLQWTFLNRLA